MKTVEARLEPRAFRDLPERAKARRDRAEAAAIAAYELAREARQAGATEPDPEEIAARVALIERTLSPRHPRQRVILRLHDEPPYFRATSARAGEERPE